ncbi:septum site-determining protein Ssd [Geodermatophilus obscurus]|uniref:Septum site determining protein n=1 Tax=Geodermatophilus obscurus (strain ATCC 25078 / DSM 43160 / JCM 3152 / CCUG 61914 / KCC A-0152 / KCTC 9177 / NBRC 13315 / NRRL B-3577 / G-20) TaxID=526225 RepID=D2S772_GEOOG|nr:septum site-determining protein Ssd [Geodermatophilus obscurus]ADB73372.1 septum site determining protein [Geodermatophilus obscurus DSM 43160]
MSAFRSPPTRLLVASADEELLDDLLRLLAAAGTEPEVATAGPALRRAHREAPLVLLGADVLTSAPVRGLPRRAGVVVVAPGELPAPVWAAAVEQGAERVAVLPADEGWLVSRVASALRRPVDRGRLVAVGGSCGGAGVSTLAAALALAAAPGSDGVLLVDTDGWGGGLDLLLGAERDEGLRWPELAGLRGRVAGDALMAALPEVAGVSVLAASRSAPGEVPAEALTAVVEAARAGGRPVVVDLPRTAGAEATAAVLAEADLAVLVVPARLLVEPAGAGRSVPWSAAQLVVRPVPGGLSTDEVADVVGRPVLGELGTDRSALPRGEQGRPPQVGARSPLGALSRRLLAELARVDGAAA